MRKIITLLVFCSGLALAQAPAPPPTASTAAETRRLLDLMGATKLINQVLESSMRAQIDGLAKLRPDIPPDFWVEFGAEFKQQVHPEELLDLMIPIYEKHFTSDDVRQLIVFYQTPVGKKFLAEVPRVQLEASQAGRIWGEQLGRRVGKQVARSLAERGYKLGTPPKAPDSK